jgi:uncharacterized protein
MNINRVVRFLVPGQDFFSLMEELAAKMTAAAAVFAELVNATSHEQLAAISNRLKPIETEADHVCRRLYELLDRTFVTPIDHEDLLRLTKALDDIVDSMEHSAGFAALFQFGTLTEPMRQLIRITAQAATGLQLAVCNLRHFKAPGSIHELTLAIHRLENEADAVYRGAVAALFADDIAPIDLVRQKDMLDALENGVDLCEDAMDVIRSVVLKNG